MDEDEAAVAGLRLAAEQRWIEYARELVGAGTLLGAPEFAARLRWGDRALNHALAVNRVFFVDCQGVHLFPAFYADPQYRRQQLEAVSRTLGALPGGSKWQFFTSLKGSLGGCTPLEAMVRGDFRQVTMAAEAFALG